MAAETLAKAARANAIFLVMSNSQLVESRENIYGTHVVGELREGGRKGRVGAGIGCARGERANCDRQGETGELAEAVAAAGGGEGQGIHRGGTPLEVAQQMFAVRSQCGVAAL